ncbi:TetR/AcrR family transcriptional regulator [Sphingomonas flavalba]|uniref:TetR/AcrR family transcriptional regulator n=1 Tax=Sphingomonas flavalba TaxID=2559804 RepID=UPI0039E171E6
MIAMEVSRSPSALDARPAKRARPNAGGRSKGRPPSMMAAAQEHVLSSLLNAANTCLEKADSSRITGRQIAEVAGVTQAMINYYFKSKEGLLSSLFERDYQDLTRKVKQFERDVENGVVEGRSIEDLIELMEVHFRERAGLLVLLHNDALRDGSVVGGTYVGRLASRCYSIVTRTMAAMIRDGRCRSDVSAEHAAYMVCSLCTIPAFLQPIFEMAFTSSADSDAHRERRRAIARMLQPCKV